MASGCYIVSTAVGIVPELVRDGVNGRIVERTPADRRTSSSHTFSRTPASVAAQRIAPVRALAGELPAGSAMRSICAMSLVPCNARTSGGASRRGAGRDGAYPAARASACSKISP
ncbi:MAG: glycosyltransferase [Longimicrobiales bacterium]